MSANAAPRNGPEPSDGTIVEVFQNHSERGLSTADVVAALPFDRDTVYEKLVVLAGQGVLDRERVPGWETIWWLADAPEGLDGDGTR
ncbi:MAG: hypothetical protein ACI9YT_001608 [Halobacteriales archaeon]|jgi:predicted transcriptional regulator